MIEIGIDTQILRDILNGRKTIEGRLMKGKFLNIEVGDEISVREDIYHEGSLYKSTGGVATLCVTNVSRFDSFADMLENMGYRSVIPSASTLEDAVSVYHNFYSEADERQYGVVAISFKTIEPASM